MACRLDVRKAILDDIHRIFIEGRYTYYRLNENTFRIASQPETAGKSKAAFRAQAKEIAVSLRNRILKQYGTNVSIFITMPEQQWLPIELRVEPTETYIETLFAKIKPEKRSEPISRLAFLQDPALYQQELQEDEPLKMIPYEAWAAQNKEADPIVDAKGQMKFFQKPSTEGQIATEKTIRDLAARMSNRIGIPVRFESDRTKQYKGKLEDNTAVINLAHATLDTPIHEILGHPIIRALRGEIKSKVQWENSLVYTIRMDGEPHDLSDEAYSKYVKEQLSKKTLYQNLLKELEYGKGKEVLDRIKRDYKYKSNYYIVEDTSWGDTSYNVVIDKSVVSGENSFKTKEEAEKRLAELSIPYTLEEQQEEAIVELLGLYTAGRLNAAEHLNLISLLKQLLGRIKAFVRDLLFQKEVEIDKLPDNMTIGDLADLLAYSNNKLILPGYEVIYTTPDNQQFKTYGEANKHISDLARSVEDVDLSNTTVNDTLPKFFTIGDYFVFKQGNNYIIKDEEQNIIDAVDLNKAKELYKESYEYQTIVTKIASGILTGNNIQSFIEKNKEYEQSKEIIEEWKRINNIQYNPEEVYSRGQEFVSVVGAYSNFDVNLMMQNLLQHIEDNEKAGGEFVISAFTKPVDRTIGHLEGDGGKIKFKIYPKSADIKWAANTDVYSGSVWDASTKVSKDKKSELLGVSYTKYPSLPNVNAVQPNLASIVDNLAHHHNELGIVLTGNNFRLEYDENIPYSTKKIIDSINSILDQKYGKLVKPDISKKVSIETKYKFGNDLFNSLEEAKKAVDLIASEDINEVLGFDYSDIQKITKPTGILPTQTNETLKESIDNIKSKLGISAPNIFGYDDFSIGDIVTVKGLEGEYRIYEYEDSEEELGVGITEIFFNIEPVDESTIFDPETNPKGTGRPYFRVPTSKMKRVGLVKKEYTEQALINTKIAKLKEVAKKYPRSLIRSEVVSNNLTKRASFEGELPFQKIFTTQLSSITEVPDVMASILYQNNHCK